MKIIKLAVALYGLFLIGCASNPMAVSSGVSVENPRTDEAQVIFMRDSFVGSAISATVYDVTGSEPVFIGILKNETKLAYKTAPGKYTFMVVSEAADFMEAELIAGKTFFSIVTPRTGFWKARFSMWPVKSTGSKHRLDSDDFRKWNQSTQLATMTPTARSWYESNKSSVMAKQREYLPVWHRRSQADLELRTLRPEDGL